MSYLAIVPPNKASYPPKPFCLWTDAHTDIRGCLGPQCVRDFQRINVWPLVSFRSTILVGLDSSFKAAEDPPCPELFLRCACDFGNCTRVVFFVLGKATERVAAESAQK